MLSQKNHFLKKIPCPLCNSRLFKTLYKSTLIDKDFDQDIIKNNLKNTLDDYTKHAQIVRCKKCSLVYTNPPEDLESLMKGYADVEDTEYLQTEKYRKILLSEHLDEIETWQSPGKILDVGCFAGFFLSIAQKRGWESYGIEPSSWAVRIAKRDGAKIIGGDILKTKLKSNFFDAVVLWDVIEHLPNPKKVIRIIYKSLKPNGIVVLGTPNIDSLFAKVLGPRCPFLIRMHIILFSPRTLEVLLKDAGFQVIKTKNYGRVFPLLYILDRIQIKNRILNRVKESIKKIPLLSNLVIRMNFHDSFLIVARKT